MSEQKPLTHDAEEGTKVEVQSTTRPEKFYIGYVDSEGKVRTEIAGAIFNANNYTVTGEK